MVKKNENLWNQGNERKALKLYKESKKLNSFVSSLNTVIITTRITLSISLVPRRSLLTRCPREVWERAGKSLSVTSQLTVESRMTAPRTPRD